MRPYFSCLIVFALLLISCGSRVTTKHQPDNNYKVSKTSRVSNRVQAIIKTADSYIGTPYRYGGESSSGMDCSGFVSIVFSQHHIDLPRISREQAKAGHSIRLKEVQPGDLLFFATSGGSRINHVGIVHDIGSNGEIHFIHASSSRGVMISSMNLEYWKSHYVKARRVL